MGKDKPTGPLTADDLPIDADILPLVNAINSDDDFSTFASCSGHQEKLATVDFAVRGLNGIKCLTRILNSIRNALPDEGIWMEVSIIWNDEVATACDWENQPEWLNVTFKIEKLLEAGPSGEILKRIAEEFSSASSKFHHE